MGNLWRGWNPIFPHISYDSNNLWGEGLGLLEDLVDVSDHVESGLGDVVELSAQNSVEAEDGVGQGNVHAGGTGESLGDLENVVREWSTWK